MSTFLRTCSLCVGKVTIMKKDFKLNLRPENETAALRQPCQQFFQYEPPSTPPYSSFLVYIYTYDSCFFFQENGRDLSWLPTVQDVIKVFNNYGADFNSLLTNVCETIDIGRSLKLLAVKDDTVKT